MVKVAVTSATFSGNASLVQGVRQIDANARINFPARKMAGDELVEFLSDCDAAIIGTEQLSREVLEKLPKLKVVAKYGVGLDSLDLDCMAERGVRLGWTGGVNRRSVAELTLAFMLGLTTNSFFTGYDLKRGEWRKQGGFELTGKTVGLIGCGFIGEDVLRLLQPFQCRLLIHDILDKSAVAKVYGAQQVGFEELLVDSNVVSLHVPLTARTRHMIGRKELDGMGRETFLINTARGELVDQAALKSALQKDLILGAALDVFELEPPEDEEFLALPNLMVSPHIGGNSRESVAAMGQAALDGLVREMEAAGLVRV